MFIYLYQLKLISCKKLIAVVFKVFACSNALIRLLGYNFIYIYNVFLSSVLPGGLVVRIRGSHPRGPGSIPGLGTFCNFKPLKKIRNCLLNFTL